MFLRDKRVSGKNINKGYDDITKVRRNNSYKSILSSEEKRTFVTILFIGLMAVFRFPEYCLVQLSYISGIFIMHLTTFNKKR